MASMIAKSRHRPAGPSPDNSFSEKELVVIQRICREQASKEIAAEMNLSLRTVEGIRQRIQEKMGVRNAAGIVVYAIREGLYKI
jgi:DNA-binding NarL/FixJ family response regulator